VREAVLGADSGGLEQTRTEANQRYEVIRVIE
jgi:hypothetical protein